MHTLEYFGNFKRSTNQEIHHALFYGNNGRNKNPGSVLSYFSNFQAGTVIDSLHKPGEESRIGTNFQLFKQ